MTVETTRVSPALAAAEFNAHPVLSGRVKLLVSDALGPEWLALAAIAHPDAADAVVATAAALCGGCDTRVARTAAAGLLLGDLASAFASVSAGILIGQRRALVIDPADAHLTFGEHGVSGVGARSPRLVAGQPIEDLRRAATRNYTDLLTPAVDLVAGAVQRGRRALWADVADRYVSAAFLAARAVHGPAQARAEAEAAIDGSPAELRHTMNWIDVAGTPWIRRSVCCLAYQTPRWSQQYCATCPLVAPEESAARIGADLAGGRTDTPMPGS